MHALGLSIGNTLGNYTSYASGGAPTIDLNGASSGINHTLTFVQGDEATFIFPDAAITGNDLTEITITCTQFDTDGASEQLEWGANFFPSNADASATYLAGSTTFAIDYTAATQTFVCTKNGGGTFSSTDAAALLAATAYWNQQSPITIAYRTFAVTVSTATATSAAATLTAWVTNARLPAETMDTTRPTGWDGTADYTPANATELQTAIDSACAASGLQIIELDADTNYGGKFTFATKADTNYIIIRTSDYATLPVSGTRVTPLDEDVLARVANNTSTGYTFHFPDSTGYVWMIGLNLTHDSHTTATSIPAIAYLSSVVHTAGNAPTNIVFDQCWIHGHDDASTTEGIGGFWGSNIAVIDSYIDEIHTVSGATPSQGESHGMQLAHGYGPITIDNNFIAAGEIPIFAGDNISSSDANRPQDLTITRNHIKRPSSWFSSQADYQGVAWKTKNLFELKIANRVLIEGNLFEGNVQAGVSQSGHAIIFTSRTSGGAGTNAVEHVTFRNNVVRNCLRGFSIASADVSTKVRNVCIWNNLQYGIESYTAYLQWSDGGSIESINFQHNTMLQTGVASWDVRFDTVGTGSPDVWRWQDNIMHGDLGAAGTADITTYTDNYQVHTNGMIDVDATGGYTTTTGVSDWIHAATVDAADFTAAAPDDIADFALLNTSPFYQQATDGTDLGADIADIVTAISGVVNNNPPHVVLGASQGSHSFTFTQGDAATDLFYATARVYDHDGDEQVSLTITVTGILDGDEEIINIGGTAFPLATSDTATGIVVSSQSFDVDMVATAGTATFTITATSGNMPVLKLSALLQTITYVNNATPVTESERLITVTSNDGTDDSYPRSTTITAIGLETLDDWQRKQPITIQATKIDANLTDFTVYVTRAMLASEIVDPSSGNKSQADGGDIRFSSDAAGVTQLPLDVIAWEHDTTTGAGDAQVLVAVKVPAIDATTDTTIYIWYKPTTAKTQPDASRFNGANNAYDVNFAGFWPDAGTVDRTVNARTLTANGSPTVGGASGPIASVSATDFNGSSQYMQLSSNVPTSYPITLIAWGEPDNATNEFAAATLSVPGSTDVRGQIRFAGSVAGDPVRAIEAFGTQEVASTSTGFSANTWTHATARFDSTSSKAAFKNGGSKGTDTTNSWTSSNPTRFTLAATHVASVTLYFDGALALVELHTASRSDAWIKANYEMIADAAGFGVAGSPSAP